MAEEFPDHSVGVITPDGELVSIDDTDRIISIVVKGTVNPDDTVRILREFAPIRQRWPPPAIRKYL